MFLNKATLGALLTNCIKFASREVHIDRFGCV